MTKAIKYINRVCSLAAILLIYAGCRPDVIETPVYRPGTGITVDVELSVRIPQAVNSGDGPVSRSVSGKQEGAARSFEVWFDAEMEQAPRSAEAGEPATRSDGTTKLYNLWIFQFNADGTISRNPSKISNEVTAVNDMVTLSVPLTVASDQTLYLVALGQQITADFSDVKSIKDLESREFAYTSAQGGGAVSNITKDEDIPFAGSVSGVNVLQIDAGKQGLVEYNSPDGFAGNIGIRRLMSRITLRYKFDVPAYQLEGLKLLNVNSLIRLSNPEKNKDTDTYVDLLDTSDGKTDADGFYSATWYVAQNCQGDVADILIESDRYNKMDGSPTNKAPLKGTNIEAWAYSKNNSSSYAIYQMYVGENNTSNFDVKANHIYNLHTTINTDLASAANDGRVRPYRAVQSIYLTASGREGSSGEGNKGNDYDLDAHYDCRPVIVNTKGRKVSVGIYTDFACTTLADDRTSWLKISSSDNYTDAVNNLKEPLGTFMQTPVILPSELKFYLYCDEFMLADGEAPDPDTKRELYVKVITTTEGVTSGAINSLSDTYTLRQRSMYYVGQFGGEMVDGEFTLGLGHDRIIESELDYTPTAQVTSSKVPFGYYNAGNLAATVGYRTLNYFNGKEATRDMAENPRNVTVNTGLNNVKQTLHHPDGRLVLNQYTYYNTYAARYCYDRNRDENGNGIIDPEEMKWYLPSVYQALAMNLFTEENSFNMYWTASESSQSSSASTYTVGGLEIDSKGRNLTSMYVRCVREFPVKQVNTPKTYVYTDERGNTYAGIDSRKALRRVEDRSTNSNFYVRVGLYEYTPTGEATTPVLDDDGNPVSVLRTRRHNSMSAINGVASVNANASSNFIISPMDVYDDGTTTAEKGGNHNMYWATAQGYLATANTTNPDIPASATPKGCPMYRGKDGQDAPGTWRVPTGREMGLIIIYLNSIEKELAARTGFVPYKTGDSYSASGGSYWGATENGTSGWSMVPAQDSKTIRLLYLMDKKFRFALRCIRDIP